MEGDGRSLTCSHCGQRLDEAAAPRKKSSAAKILLWVGLAVGSVVILFGVLVGTVLTYVYFQAKEHAKPKIAARHIEILTLACDNYHLHNGQFPPNLEALLTSKRENGEPYLADPKFLVDPWGNSYHYDPSGARNGGRPPDIWTTSPKGEEVGNWQVRDTKGP
jgi:hypothetical protein